MRVMYQVGQLTDYEVGDAEIEVLEAAYRVALECSEESDETVIGVWSEDGNNLLAIAHQGDLFVRVTT